MLRSALLGRAIRQPRVCVSLSELDGYGSVMRIVGEFTGGPYGWATRTQKGTVRSSSGVFPFDTSNEAYKLGVNYLIYAATH